ncbi:hypothetical protein D915_005102 [Fasciola hepatica]|uniref:Transmembrane protein 39A n=1 Tax=Fasciola hepatica TaxID=6192 RepID=A0A4E0RCU0_FASHE|nr:hypothetical protein D915_005102 [Fasciola hepatica]
MPIGRRFTARPTTSQSLSNTCQNTATVNSAGLLPLLLHCALVILSVLVQYLNLYKTVWWIPDSPFNYAIDFEAIDYYVMAHIILMGLTPSLYRIFLSLYSGPLAAYPVLRFLGGIPLFGTWFFLAVYTALGVDTMGYTWLYCAYLYALLLYLPVLACLLYNTDRLKHLCLRMSLTHPKRSRRSCAPSVNIFHGFLTKLRQITSKLFWACADWPGMTPNSALFPIRYMTVSNEPTGSIGNSPVIYCSHHYGIEPGSKSTVLLRHQCLNSAEQVREEVALFRGDFNIRLMDVLFNASYTVYYSCFLPVLFLKPNGLVYDGPWCIQHGLVTWLVTFLLFWYFHLPADYLDMLHRSALHLGCWIPENSYTVSAQSSAWSPAQIYASGATVKHVRGQFRSIEPSNAAEPGNIQHVRFHSWFYSPLRIPSLLMYVSLALPLGQLISLKWVFEWYKLIGMVAMGMFALYNHYVHIRTYAVLRAVYTKDGQPTDAPS